MGDGFFHSMIVGPEDGRLRAPAKVIGDDDSSMSVNAALALIIACSRRATS
jgi:hypothetical protein